MVIALILASIVSGLLGASLAALAGLGPVISILAYFFGSMIGAAGFILLQLAFYMRNTSYHPAHMTHARRPACSPPQAPAPASPILRAVQAGLSRSNLS